MKQKKLKSPDLLFKHGFSIVLACFAIIYLATTFSSITQVILFLSCLVIIYYTGIIFVGFFEKLFIEKIRSIDALYHYRFNYLIILGLITIIGVLGTGRLISAILTGVAIIILILGIFFYLKGNASNGDK